MRLINSENSTDFIDKKEVIKISYDKLGCIVDGEIKGRIFAESREIKIDDKKQQNKYSILMYRNIPYDPYGVDSNYENSANIILKNVNENTFNFYIQYLQTRNSIYMTYAQRSFLNG